jgi:hypothetical protein
MFEVVQDPKFYNQSCRSYFWGGGGEKPRATLVLSTRAGN